MNLEALGITADELREQIIERAATKLADDAGDEGYLGDRAIEIVKERIERSVAKNLDLRIEQTLAAEMGKILRETITPVDIWGERTGAPTTLRDALAERARVFWDVRVDKEGKPSTYGGSPRHEHLLRQLLNEEFTKAVRENITGMVTAFRDAVKVDAARITAEHIDKLIPKGR